MRVQDIMTTGVVTTTPDTPLTAALNLMQQQAIRHLVVQDGSEVVGVLSARDVGPRRRRPGAGDQHVSDVMSRDVVTIAPTATVKQAANVMRGRLIGSLVVTEHARPVGILTVSDLLELVGRGGARVPPATPRPLLHHRAPHKKRHVSVGSW